MGVLSKPMRTFIKELIILSGDQNEFIDVNCGSFAIAECAAMAGVKKIICSDIGLYSSVIGYYITKKKIAGLKIVDSEGKCYKNAEDVLFIYWLDKLKRNNYYNSYIFKNIIFNSDYYKLQILCCLNKIKGTFNKINITYELKDMDTQIKEHDQGVLFLDPPGTIKNDYTSTLKWIGDLLEQTCIKDNEQNYAKYLRGKRPVIIRRFRKVGASEKKYIVYAESKRNKFDYLLSNIKIKIKYVRLNKSIPVNPGTYKIFTDEDLITGKSVPFLKIINKNVALYYRDLFNRGMGPTRAERYVGFFIDGKLVGVSGFFVDKYLRNNSNYVFEQFGFSVRTKIYPRMNKLHMMVLTSQETAQMLKDSNNTINKRPEYFSTVCITKHHEQKGNRGILKLIEREQMENGLFHIKYETKFYSENWQERMIQFLRKEKYDITTGKKV